MPKILKRGKIWYIDFQYKGKRIRRSLKTKSKKVAELALKNFDLQIVKKELNFSSPRKISFLKFSKRFLDCYQVQNSKKSFNDYDNLFISTIIPYLMDYQPSDISVEIVENYKIE